MICVKHNTSTVVTFLYQFMLFNILVTKWYYFVIFKANNRALDSHLLLKSYLFPLKTQDILLGMIASAVRIVVGCTFKILCIM